MEIALLWWVFLLSFSSDARSYAVSESGWTIWEDSKELLRENGGLLFSVLPF